MQCLNCSSGPFLCPTETQAQGFRVWNSTALGNHCRNQEAPSHDLNLLVNYNIHFSDVHVFILSHGAVFPLERCADELPSQAAERDRFPLSQVMWAAFRITENK